MNTFKQLRPLGALVLLLVIGFVEACNAGIVTNVMLKTTFALTAYVQEDTNSTTWTISNHKLGNADIVNAIVSDTGLPASDYNSSSLILSSTILIPNKHLGFALRSLTGAALDTDLSTNLDLTIPNQYQVITSIRPAPYGRTTNSVDLTIFQFALNTTNLSFNVQGPAMLNSTSVSYKGRVIDKYPFTSLLTVSLAGTGTLNGKNATFKGTFRASTRQVELGTARPNLAGATRLDGTNLVISGFNGSPSNTFYILASTDLNAPLNTWIPVVTNVFDNTGSFVITNAIDPAVSQNFFILNAP